MANKMLLRQPLKQIRRKRKIFNQVKNKILQQKMHQ